MFNFFQREDVQSKMIGLSVLNCAIICYQCFKKKNNYKKKIQQVAKAPIYEFEEFMEIQKQKNRDLQYVMGKQDSELGKDGFYLVKMKPKDRPFIEHQQKIYSNQIKFCPPSINIALKQALNEHQKGSKFNQISLDSLTKDRYSIFKGKILTDKISYTTHYKPEPQIQVNLDQNFILIAWEYFIWFGSKFHQKVAYFAQLILEKLKFRKNYKRSRDSKRAPLIKGIFTGVLTSYFSFLTDSKFLLKVNIEGGQFSTQLIADNKLMIMDFYSSQIKKQNLFIFMAATAALGGISFLIYKFRPWLEIYWKNWTKKQYKKINTSGLTDDKLCQICYTNCRNVIFFQCRHLIVCEQCYWHIDQTKCIICNEKLEEKKVIFPLPK